MDLEKNKADFERKLYKVQDMAVDLESSIQDLVSEYKGYLEKDLDYVLDYDYDIENLGQENLDLQYKVEELTELLEQAHQEIANGKTEESNPFD